MKFNRLPWIVKIAVILTFFNTWVMIEEFVIDRFGYWEYLPFYRKGIFCTWDIFFIFGTAALLLVSKNQLRSVCKITNCMICSLRVS